MEPHKKDLIDLLKLENGFIIPPFQRRYEWDEKQCEILCNDIFKTANINSNSGHELTKSIHFFGTFIVSSDGLSPFTVIDGQQRIISSILFLAACAHSQYCSEELKAEINGIIFNNNNPRLQQNDLDQGVYEKIINNDKNFPPHWENSNLWRNYSYFQTEIGRQCHGQADLKRLLEEGLKNFHAVLLTFSSSEENLQEVFESINSTGRPLLLSDLVRNYLLMGLNFDDQKACMKSYWEPIERIFSPLKEQKNPKVPSISEFIRDYMQSEKCTSYPKPSLSNNQELYYAFKDIFPAPTGFKDMEALKRAADLYSVVVCLKSSGDPKIDQIFRDLKEMEAKTAYSFLLALLSEREKGQFNDKDVILITEPLRSYFLRRRICGLSKGEDKVFPSLIRDTENLAKAEDKRNAMYRILCGLNESGRFPSDDEFAAHLRAENFYQSEQKKKLFRLLIELINENQSRNRLQKQDNYDLQIEHVMPQKLNPAWQKELGGDAENVHLQWLNNIGNLTLISRNQEISNKSFSEKKEIYKTQPAIATDSSVMNSEQWNAQSIQNRQEYLISQALAAVPLPRQFTGNSNATSPLSDLDSSEVSAVGITACSPSASTNLKFSKETGKGKRKAMRPRAGLKDLIETGLICPGESIVATAKPNGKLVSARGRINSDGTIEIDGQNYPSLNAAYKAVMGILGRTSSEDGWRIWKTDDGRTLKTIRDTNPIN